MQLKIDPIVFVHGCIVAKVWYGEEKEPKIIVQPFHKAFCDGFLDQTCSFKMLVVGGNGQMLNVYGIAQYHMCMHMQGG